MSQVPPIHATAVVIEGKGLLLRGPSGSGKSKLALDLMSLGAQLICDDRVTLERCDSHVVAHAVPRLAGMIELREFGILRCPYVPEARLDAIVDLGQKAQGRLPTHKFENLEGISLPVFYHSDKVNMASALKLWAQMGFAQ